MSFAFSLHVVVRFTNQTRKNKWVGTSIVSRHIYNIVVGFRWIYTSVPGMSMIREFSDHNQVMYRSVYLIKPIVLYNSSIQKNMIP